MITATITEVGGVRHAKLAGIVDEGADFEGLLGAEPGLTKLDCGGLDRFNSMGIKIWIQYFERARARRQEFEFHQCPPALVQQLNSYQDFLCGGIVRSIQAAFACEGCEKFFLQVFTPAAIRSADFNLAPSPCPACGKPAPFDDIPEDYFSFLIR